MTATYAMTTPAAARRASQNVSLDRTPRLSSATSASFIVVLVLQVREVRTTPLAGYSDGEIGQAKDINELIERAVIAFQSFILCATGPLERACLPFLSCLHCGRRTEESRTVNLVK